MPGTDGQTVLTALHRESEQPVIVLSCVSDVATKVSCLDLGAQDYLTKPFALAELLARVRVSCAARGISRTRCGGPASWCSTSAACRLTRASARWR